MNGRVYSNNHGRAYGASYWTQAQMPLAFDKTVLSAASSQILNGGASSRGIVIVTREQLEHIIRAAGSISGEDRIIIIGSQAILGSYPNAPADLQVSMEADTFPESNPEKWDVIDGCIGELSPFHETS